MELWLHAFMGPTSSRLAKLIITVTLYLPFAHKRVQSDMNRAFHSRSSIHRVLVIGKLLSIIKKGTKFWLIFQPFRISIGFDMY